MSRVTVTAAAVGEGALPVGDTDVVGACVAGIDHGGVDAAADGDGSTLLDDEHPRRRAPPCITARSNKSR